MNIPSLGGYIIKNLFSFLPYNLTLKIIQKNNKLQNKLKISAITYSLYIYLKNEIFLKYNITYLNLQFIYEIIMREYKNKIDYELINELLLYFIKKNSIQFNKKINYNPLLEFSSQFSKLNFYLNYIYISNGGLCLLDLKNKNIKKIKIDLSHSLIPKEETLQDLKYALSINSYEKIKLLYFKINLINNEILSNINFNNLISLKLIEIKLNSEIFNNLLRNLSFKDSIKLKNIDLTLNKLDDNCAELLGEVIKTKMKDLEKLNIQGNKITEIGFKMIIDRIKYNNKLKKINFSWNKCGNELYELFNKYSNYFKNLIELKLYSDTLNFNNENHKNIFRNFLKNYFYLEYTDFFSTLSSQEFLKDLPDKLNIKEIRLSSIDKKVLEYINKMNKLEFLQFINQINFNKYCGKFNIKILHNLKYFKLYGLNFCSLNCLNCIKDMKNLEELEIYGELNLNNIIYLSNEICPFIQNLKILSFSSNFLQGSHIENFVNGLKYLKNLEKINLSLNSTLNFKSINLIIKQLSETNKKIIDINVQLVSMEGFKNNSYEFFTNLSNLPNLQNLNLADNNIKPDELEIFLQLIQQKDKFKLLKSIDLSKNNLLDEFWIRNFILIIKEHLPQIEIIYLEECTYLEDEIITEFINYLPGRIYINSI